MWPQGLCPSYCGRKSACCHAHFKLAVAEGFIHPGLIKPGAVLRPGSTFKRKSTEIPPSKIKRHTSAAGTLVTGPQPDIDVKSELSNFEYILHLADESCVPAKWAAAAKKLTNYTASFLSIFDGEAGNLNRAARAFDLRGLPPVDIASAARLNL